MHLLTMTQLLVVGVCNPYGCVVEAQTPSSGLQEPSGAINNTQVLYQLFSPEDTALNKDSCQRHLGSDRVWTL